MEDLIQPRPTGKEDVGPLLEEDLDLLSGLPLSLINQWFEVTGLLWSIPFTVPLDPSILYGSFGEGTATSLFTGQAGEGAEALEDIDMMFILEDILDFRMISGDSHPGFTQLDFHIPENDEEELEEDEDYGRSYHESLTKLARHGSQKFMKIWANMAGCKDNPVIAELYDSKATGPAMNISGPSEDKGIEMEKISNDLVMAIRGPTIWPPEAAGWATRARPSGWPSPELIENVIDEGFLLVPVAHARSTLPQSEWRISFSQAERFLISGLDKSRKDCYMLAKLLCKHAFFGLRLLSSYQVKTTFLWMLEELPWDMWSKERIGELVIILLDKLILFVAKGNLPSYFIPTNNLIDHLPKEHQKTILRILRRIRLKPLHGIISALQWVLCFSDDELFPLIELLNSGSENEALIHWCHYTKLGLHLRNQKTTCASLTYGPMMEIILKISQLEGWSEEQCSDLDALLEYKDVEIDLEEYQISVSYNNLAYIFGALASHFRVEYQKASDAIEKDELHVKTKWLFDKALPSQQEELPDEGLLMEYAAFLIDTGSYEDARRLLEKECQENVAYTHYVPVYGYLLLPSSFFSLWLKFNLSLRDGKDVEPLIQKYEALQQEVEDFVTESAVRDQSSIYESNCQLMEALMNRNNETPLVPNDDLRDKFADMIESRDSYQVLVKSRLILLQDMYTRKAVNELTVEHPDLGAAKNDEND